MCVCVCVCVCTCIQCSPQAKFKACQGMTIVGHTLGGVCGHIKAFGISPFTHQRKFRTEGLLGRYALRMLSRESTGECVGKRIAIAIVR